MLHESAHKVESAFCFLEILLLWQTDVILERDEGGRCYLGKLSELFCIADDGWGDLSVVKLPDYLL